MPRWRRLLLLVIGSLQQQDLPLQELDVADGFVQHRRGVHLSPSRDEPFEDPYLLAYPLPPVTSRHALGVFADSHVAPLRFPDRRRVDVDGCIAAILYTSPHGAQTPPQARLPQRRGDLVAPRDRCTQSLHLVSAPRSRTESGEGSMAKLGAKELDVE
ncbi:hypothetical protein F3Y22_tig00111769pilonHSYRG00155 [Hibiscus syriacus]|uniref:Secreted protein n=1 Tax=Hibiscus syriacus TaxID=106335 RepID=A0A6A2YH90_HIBSY|nr:hypothetical protein F3Y22_tig00111769pilonHSYRG00155 [Hibiscus syriacus]